MLSELFTRQLSDAPEPIGVGWPVLGHIYARFEVAMATRRVGFKIDTREVQLPRPAAPGELRSVPLEQARPVLRQVYESVLPTRPGWSSRDERWWGRVLADPPGRRRGATELRVTVHEGGTGPDGYVLWRGRVDWGPTGAGGEIRVEELVAADVDAYQSLWRFLLGMDLSRSVSAWSASTDERLLQLADDPRQLGATLSTGLFLRIFDLPTALTARRYAAPLDVVIEVSDQMFERNAGRWRLTAETDKASCTQTQDSADLACTVAELSAVYLGGISLASLASVGRVHERQPGALARASAAFGWHCAPSAIEFF